MSVLARPAKTPFDAFSKLNWTFNIIVSFMLNFSSNFCLVFLPRTTRLQALLAEGVDLVSVVTF